MNYLLISLGGFIGAILRYGVGIFIKKRIHSTFPIATFLVNVLGSFLLGYMIGSRIGGNTLALLGTGFLGSFTTFSTFKLESIKLINQKQLRTFFCYLFTTYIFGILLAFIGYYIGTQF
ncbi:CrcB protein [Bacillus pakistanensis]|uniref:Fluoride-specific ion channel FluC n=1 Tax=Rossellomorea pakistanensis TaxID=992288 RepID=A0ABS2N8F8_9BACI|nr:fluoride efflux transporter CrcB [Bacillus pakistanensis]MBM7584113.1 CrcB protein [Bacillus pakistanensis]